MTAPYTPLATVYCTDEDVYNIGPGDFGVIVPRSNRLAGGTDGAFAAGSPWSLASASSAWLTQGVTPGCVVRLAGPAPQFSAPQYLAADGPVTTGPLRLRRCGLAAGQGQPPAPAAGLAGVTFEVLTLYPQIENGSYHLNEQYAVDPKVVNRTPGDIYDLRIMRRLVALWVLYSQYAALNRGKLGDFADKVEFYREEFDRAQASALLRWGPSGTTQAPTGRFGTRLSR